MPTWKWGVLAIAWVLGFLLRPVIQFIFKEIKKRNPFGHRYPNGFTAHFFRLPIERPLAWLIIFFFWFAAADAVSPQWKI